MRRPLYYLVLHERLGKGRIKALLLRRLNTEITAAFRAQKIVSELNRETLSTAVSLRHWEHGSTYRGSQWKLLFADLDNNTIPGALSHKRVKTPKIHYKCPLLRCATCHYDDGLMFAETQPGKIFLRIPLTGQSGLEKLIIRVNWQVFRSRKSLTSKRNMCSLVVDSHSSPGWRGSGKWQR